MNSLYSNQMYSGFSAVPVSPYMPASPYMLMPAYEDAFAEERQSFEDARRLQSFYPEFAQEIQRHVEEECDKMEYEGSMMFDEYPDRMMIWRVAEDIFRRLDMPDEMEEPQNRPAEEEGELVSMQGGGCRHCHSDRNRLKDFIQVMLLDEMHRRRCRHRRCRRFW